MTAAVLAGAGTIPIWSAGRRPSFLLGPAFGSTLRDCQRKGRVQWSAACHEADLDLFTLAKGSLLAQTSRYVRSPMTRRWDAPLVSGCRIARAFYFLAATPNQPVSIRNCVSHFQLIEKTDSSSTVESALTDGTPATLESALPKIGRLGRLFTVYLPSTLPAYWPLTTPALSPFFTFNFQLSTFNLLPLTTRQSSSACPARRTGAIHPKGAA